MANDPSVPDAAAVPSDDDTETLEREWDEAFGWSYGRRVWNVGCG